ncbi:hypothetical protein RR42_s2848 [Cupriavidus basilensis]|uniref:Uncharacterized protein n=1 Tax=Cupriavidus basilensis TaxID=68895 RepID=A0A0C4YQZ5_9BURK|nr:hypothetical protein RR42_s2848 [Cupriavidus basilensis]
MGMAAASVMPITPGDEFRRFRAGSTSRQNLRTGRRRAHRRQEKPAPRA